MTYSSVWRKMALAATDHGLMAPCGELDSAVRQPLEHAG